MLGDLDICGLNILYFLFFFWGVGGERRGTLFRNDVYNALGFYFRQLTEEILEEQLIHLVLPHEMRTLESEFGKYFLK